MKINFISYNNGYGLTKDMELFKTNLDNIYDNLDIKLCDFFDHKIRNADINIFFEIVSNILIKKAKYNVLIPNQEWFYKNWIDYLENIDLVLAKTEYGKQIFSKFTNTKFIGWESEDLLNDDIKDYDSVLHSCGKSMFKQTQFILNNWEQNFPHLTVVYQEDKMKLNCPIQKNITYISKRLNDNEIKSIMNQKGIHLCCSETEGFGHYINESRSCKNVIITTDAEPMKSFISNPNYLVKVEKQIILDNVLDFKNILDLSSFQNTIRNVMKKKKKEFIKEGEINRNNFLKDRLLFRNNIKNIFDEIFLQINHQISNETIINDLENLPKISIVTITRNREKFIKLCLLNIFQSNFPLKKIEWIIIDDSDTPIEKLLPNKDFIKYYHYENKINIGKKRNIGVEKATHDYILFMDDDDYYPPKSFVERINKLLNHNKDCVFCSSIGCFHINKYMSIMNVPPHQDAFHERVSEATLCFKKTFWEEKHFLDDCQGAEGSYFIKDRYSKCLEIEPENIIVSLLHKNNTSNKKLPITEPNGCHFNFSDKLFNFITNLDS